MKLTKGKFWASLAIATVYIASLGFVGPMLISAAGDYAALAGFGLMVSLVLVPVYFVIFHTSIFKKDST